MLKKNYLISFILFAIPGMLLAQPSVERWVIGSAGGAYTGPGLSLDYTVGEVATATLSSTGNVLTQGFHQPGGIMVSVPETESPEPMISVYPNPVTDFINISIQNTSYNRFQVTVYDLMGKLILKQDISVAPGNARQLSLDLASAAPGNYFLRISAGNDFRQVSRFIKIQP